MTYAVLLGALALTVCGIFLNIRSLIRLNKEEERKMLLFALIEVIALPILFSVGLSVWYGALNIWKSLMLFMMWVGWVVLGFYFDSYLRSEKARKLAGQEKIIRKAPPHTVRNQCLLIAAALIVWCYGAFVGIPYPLLETCLLVVSIFLLISGCAKLWRYRGF